jgi:hypothetical protein
MNHISSAIFFAVGLFLGMLLLFEVGRRLRANDLRTHHENELGLGEVEGAIFGLFGLLVAFTFSGAMQRFDAHRSLIAEEANAIGTAYLRLDLLPTNVQPVLRGLFRSYLDARLGVYRDLPDVQASSAEQARAKSLQSQIWSEAVAASALPGAQRHDRHHHDASYGRPISPSCDHLCSSLCAGSRVFVLRRLWLREQQA